eukprot:RCo053065
MCLRFPKPPPLPASLPPASPPPVLSPPPVMSVATGSPHFTVVQGSELYHSPKPSPSSAPAPNHCHQLSSPVLPSGPPPPPSVEEDAVEGEEVTTQPKSPHQDPEPTLDPEVEALLACLDALAPGSDALHGAKQYYSGGCEQDPRFEVAALRWLQDRVRALLRDEESSQLDIGKPELSRARLALRIMKLSPAQFAALFLYTDEIKGSMGEGKPSTPTQATATQGHVQPCPAEGETSSLSKPGSKCTKKPDQLYTLLTSAQRAAFGADPSSPAQAALNALAPIIDAIQAYLNHGPVPKVDPEEDVLFRGVAYEVSEKEASNRRLPWMCFSSASLSASTARSFLRPGGTLFVVRSAEAVAIYFLSAFMSEVECLVPPTEFILRDALPISILRMMGVQGSVMLLEDPKMATTPGASQRGLASKLLLQRKLDFLFQPLREKYVTVSATPDRQHQAPSYALLRKLCENVLESPRTDGRVPTDLVLSSGGRGKTCTGLLLQQHCFPKNPEIFVIFISLPLVGENLCASEGRGLAAFLENTMGLSKSDFSEA